MKKIIVMAVFVTSVMVSSQAQDATNDTQTNVKFGAKGGLNISNYAGDGTGGLDARTSFHIGGVVEFIISEKFSFQPELMYSSQGAKAQMKDSGLTIDLVDKADYLNIPLMGKLYLADNFSLEAGPQVGFLLSAKQEGSTNSEGTDISASVDVKDMRKSIDFGVNLGLGYRLESGLNFGARYNIGLSNINDVEGLDDKNQNSVIQLSVGFMF